MARWAFERIDPRPVEGQRVQVHGKVTLYDKRAELSLRADRIEPAGDGALLARIEEARRRLDADGLFDAARKRRPPLWPRGIGLIAGHDAAAPLDVIRNARARLPRRASCSPRRRCRATARCPRSCARWPRSTRAPTST